MPLTIRMSRHCEAPVAPDRIAAEYESFDLRGAKAYAESALLDYLPSVFVRTGKLNINIEGGDGVGGARHVALNLIRANGGKPSSPSEPFDPPVSECHPANPTPFSRQ